MQKLSDKVNELRVEAEKWVKDNGSSGLFGPFPNRSCWNCNSAHERLKDADYPIECFNCGHIYFRGERITETEEESAELSHNSRYTPLKRRIAADVVRNKTE